MNSYDPEVARRVWQRVQQPMPEASVSALPIPNLSELMAGKWQDAAIYQQLSKGLQNAAFHKLQEEEQAQLACLQGIYAMRNGSRPPIHQAAPKPMPAEAALRRCCSRELQSYKAYLALSSDPEYGPVFARLARQELEHCLLALELLGRFEPKPKHPTRR